MAQPNQLKRGLLIALLVFLIIFEVAFLLLGVFSVLIDDEDAAGQTALSYLFVIGLFGFSIWWTLRQLRLLKHKKSYEPREQSVDLTQQTSTPLFHFQVKLELSEYRKLLYRLTYVRPAIIFVHFLGGSLSITYAINGELDWFLYFFLFFILFIPISVYRAANSNYKSSKALHQMITYDITEDTITASGETFNSTVTWSSLYKTREFTDFILLYTSKNVANIIPKRAFESDQQLKNFLSLCERVKL